MGDPAALLQAGFLQAGMIGSLRRADFTVIGDSVNLASRLCGIAKGMQIVVSDTTMREAGRDFRFNGPFSVRVKGKSQPQRVWLLTEGGPSALPAGDTPRFPRRSPGDTTPGNA